MEITKLEMDSVWKVLLVSLAFVVGTARSECNVCQENGAACVNTTSFYLCFGETTPNTDVMYHCKDGFDCTSLNAICVQSSSTLTPSCGDTSLCGLCSAHRNYLFACTGRTTFQMCYGATQAIGQAGRCPDGYVCDATNDAICVDATQPHTITCDIVDDSDDTDSSSEATYESSTESTTESANESSTESSTESTTDSSTETSTTASSNMTPNEVCALMLEVGLFPTIPNDPNCLRYISCYYKNGVILGTEYNCSSGSYFNIEREQCVFDKPSYCT